MIAGEIEGGEFRLMSDRPIGRTLRILLSRILGQRLVMTVQDITREVELNEAKSQFISNVSHELRTPLFNIKSFICHSGL